MFVYIYLYHRDIFLLILVTGIVDFIIGKIWLDKYIEKLNDDFVKEIDELLKEE